MAEAKSKAKKGLGRGLGAFFDEAVTAVDEKVDVTESPKAGGVMKIKIRDIEPNPEQPRRNFDKEAQLIALNKAKDIALEQMTDDVKNFISKNYGSVDAWLTTTIESTINLIKNKK